VHVHCSGIKEGLAFLTEIGDNNLKSSQEGTKEKLVEHIQRVLVKATELS
jgi:hypothetical protein